MAASADTATTPINGFGLFRSNVRMATAANTTPFDTTERSSRSSCGAFAELRCALTFKTLATIIQPTCMCRGPLYGGNRKYSSVVRCNPSVLHEAPRRLARMPNIKTNANVPRW